MEGQTARRGLILLPSNWKERIGVLWIRSGWLRDDTERCAEWISPEVRAQAPNTPWRRIAGLRDVLIHQYFGVDLEAVWLVVEKEV